MSFEPNKKWQSNTFEKCFLIVLEDMGDTVEVMIHHSEQHIERTWINKNYIEYNYTPV